MGCLLARREAVLAACTSSFHMAGNFEASQTEDVDGRAKDQVASNEFDLVADELNLLSLSTIQVSELRIIDAFRRTSASVHACGP